MSAIELHGSWTVQDFIRFQYAHMFRRTWIFLFVAAACLVGPVSFLFPDTRSIALNALPFSGICLAWLALLVPWSAWRSWKARPSLRESATIWFDADGMRNKTADSSAQVAWRLILSVRETKSLFLMYYAPNMAYLVPKRFFANAEDIAAFRALVADSVVPHTITPPGLVARWC
jgi:hypothetical protein